MKWKITRKTESASWGLKRGLRAGAGAELPTGPEPTDLAALVYTSGTTGKPKGVMLTHRAILANVTGVLQNVCPEPEDVWFSFLPLSHTFERTTTYYTALGCGNRVAFNRNISLIQDDLKQIRPTVMMSVPRIYEKIYEKIQDQLAKKPKFIQFLFQWAVDCGYRRFCRENGCPLSRAAFSRSLIPSLRDSWIKRSAPVSAPSSAAVRIFLLPGAQPLTPR